MQLSGVDKTPGHVSTEKQTKKKKQETGTVYLVVNTHFMRAIR